jgi:hypothetical protein
MRYQLPRYAGHGGQSGADEPAVVPIAEPLTGGAAGAAGLQWLWALVELRLSQDEPDTAA